MTEAAQGLQSSVPWGVVALLTVLTLLEQEGQLAAVRCWRTTLVLPVYGRLQSPDDFLAERYAPHGGAAIDHMLVWLLRGLQGLTGLERVTLRLCAPHDHFNATTGRVCCPAHGPRNLGRSTLPSWGRLRELVLTDLSFRGTRNQVELVHVLLLALTRDAALAVRLAALSSGSEDGEPLQAALLAEPPRAGCLERLELKGVLLSGERGPSTLFWLTVCAFVPQQRLQLTETSIPWPAADYVYPASGTLFPPRSYVQYNNPNTTKRPLLDLRQNASVLRPLHESRFACPVGVEVLFPF